MTAFNWIWTTYFMAVASLSGNCIELTNVALLKPAEQSSTKLGDFGGAHKAVDGNMNTHISHCTHTADDSVPRWWRVDLLERFYVHAVELTNRGDCCSQRLGNFDVEVSAQNPLVANSTLRHVCAHQDTSIPQGATVRLDCTQPISGRHVRVLLYKDDVLTLCEVKVLASPLSTAPVTSGLFRRLPRSKASGDVIGEVMVASVTKCATACVTEPRCTAANIGPPAAPSVMQRACELVSYGGIGQDNSFTAADDWQCLLMTA
ncbi:hypothetical protein BaRGS_00020894 [Batillaria attramentaria]|uniref:Fucolectin tachylectin-4 pentraxin-1 domain-containing protein n=1 Tax=Batillaria attramentaria TaxID=370345 RepID=A0ABD0KL62_9CAEN